jgi:hypothetical protein
MALDERARHELFLGLEQVLGPERAGTLMELMPPVGWADVATKRDLDALEERMDLRFELVDQRFEGMDRRFGALDQRFEASEHKLLAGFRAELLAQTNVLTAQINGMTAQMNGMTAQMRVLILAIIGSMVSVAALVVGALRLS